MPGGQKQSDQVDTLSASSLTGQKQTRLLEPNHIRILSCYQVNSRQASTEDISTGTCGWRSEASSDRSSDIAIMTRVAETSSQSGNKS